MTDQKLNNRTIVHWACKLEVLEADEQQPIDADQAVERVPSAFIKSLEELVAEDTYLRFGDFAVKFYEENPDDRVELNKTLDEIKKGFDLLAANQKSSDRSIGELAAEAGIIRKAHIALIEDARYRYYRGNKPFQLILKERYDGLVHASFFGRVKTVFLSVGFVVVIIGVVWWMASQPITQ